MLLQSYEIIFECREKSLREMPTNSSDGDTPPPPTPGKSAKYSNLKTLDNNHKKHRGAVLFVVGNALFGEEIEEVALKERNLVFSPLRYEKTTLWFGITKARLYQQTGMRTVWPLLCSLFKLRSWWLLSRPLSWGWACRGHGSRRGL